MACGQETTCRLFYVGKSDVIGATHLTLQITQYSTDCRLAPVTVNNSPIQDYVHPHDNTQPTYEWTPEFKPSQKGIF